MALDLKLVADVGATYTRIALFERLTCMEKKIYSSQDYESLTSVLLDFLRQLPRDVQQACQRACLGLPGPVINGRCQITNLPWQVDGEAISRATHIPLIRFINDLEAHAYSLSLLTHEEIDYLQPGEEEASGHRALIVAGTGLGEAGLFWNGVRHQPFASEGGHSDFGPIDKTDIALWHYLHRHYGHVSYERILSGHGLCDLYRFFLDFGGSACAITSISPQEIIEQGLHKGCATSRRALEKFSALYGSEAGNLALKFLSFGGVYIGGRLANAILPYFREQFLTAFLSKGRLRPLLQAVPVTLILNQDTGLLGASLYLDL